ncbi:PREDICTED: probable FBD-associated F-box protein At1g32375 [Camelina sativa]|uniref:Probable FBD-associated F-box protein At1g32375 n=1 Tax=Camelina sativa TaxID=90675 RepID=A0ABM1R9F7_CAMSA|nr:PREDICTED: probable FBD-associated F-box protein At1g32375 [Camelina sativa]
MDSLSEFPDALLLSILSFLPAKDVVATMVLSKRWQPLWKMVPRLIYDDDSDKSFPRFVDRSLLLHEAPVIESLHFKLGEDSGAVDIGVWTRTALKRCVRKLIIKTDCCINSTAPVILPRSVYTGCSMLVRLKLKKVVLLDVTSPISFPCLKKLSLKCVKYPSDEFFGRLLSTCPVLESLVVRHCPDDNVTIFTIKVPSLKSLVMTNYSDSENTDIVSGFMVDTPSLENFDILDSYEGGFCVIENEMPNIVEAYVDVAYHPGNILSSITSVKHLFLCNRKSPKDAYPVGKVFCSLVYLKIWKSKTDWLSLLMRFLKDSPNLRALKLETKATISTESTDDPNKKLEMVKELSLFPRRSPTCQLAFD